MRLSFGEYAFLRAVRAQLPDPVQTGDRVPIGAEGRAVAGLEKKGLLFRADAEAVVTEAGAAWFAKEVL